MRKKLWNIMLVLMAVCLVSIIGQAEAAYAKTYKISPKSKPCDNSPKFDKYNKQTKTYWLINSYLQKIASEKGGTLVLKKGTYKVSNTLYVSSNTKIILNDGVVIEKETDTKTSLMPAASSIFQFINRDKAQKTSVVGKHDGEKNISIIGKGTAVIDLKCADMGTKDVIGIIMGHNRNITVKNITFKNMRRGHLIEMDACENVTISDCTFTGFSPSGYFNKEAINLDTPDDKREGFKSEWSKKDGTPNENVVITNCKFENLEAGIGTHRYTGDSYHTDVTVKDCTFKNVQTSMRILNWKNATITNNTFTDCVPNDRYLYSMFMAGVKGITFSNNSFTNCGTGTKDLLEFWCDKGYAANQTIYPATFSEITEEQAALFLTNTATNCGIIHVYVCPYNVDFAAQS